MSKYHAPALDKGLDILEYLSKMAVPQSQIEISSGIDKTPNEIYRMLVCLEERGYITRNADSGKFFLTLKLFNLSHRHTPVDGLLKAAKPIMETLSNQTKQSCHIGILFDGQLMIVAQTRSPGPVTLSIEVGSLFPLTLTASGKVLLACMSEKQRKAQLTKNTEYQALSAVEKKTFLQRLETICEKGYELNPSEITSGVTDIAVPVGNPESGIFAAIAVSSLSSVDDQNKKFDVLIKRIRESAEKINSEVGI